MILILDGDVKTLLWQVGNVVYAGCKLPVGATVLEIGSGQNPHPASQVVVDKFLDGDNSHRPAQFGFLSEPEFIINTPDGIETKQMVRLKVVQGDVIELPFPDKSFDFVIAKDVLEHVDDVERAFAEVSRVGKKGFIDVPKITSEWIYPQGKDIHKWVFEHVNDTFIARSVVGFVSPFGRYMHDINLIDPKAKEIWSKSRMFFHVARFWEGEAKLKIGKPITYEGWM